MVGLTRLLLRRSWGWLVVGIIMVIGGLIWGLTSHQVTYANSQQNASYHIAIGESTGNVYINADGSSDYFAAFSGDFSPAITQSDIDNSTAISFIARTDTSTLNPALNAPNGSTVNDAHKVEKLVFYDKNGNIQKTFTTAEYLANPNGFNDNEWLKAIWLVLGGLVVTILSIVSMARNRRVSTNTGFSINAPGALPYQQVPPVQQPNPYAPTTPPNPYGQEYQGPAQYPQPTPYAPPQAPAQYPPQAPPHPPQPPVYGQPPYQQPPQG